MNKLVVPFVLAVVCLVAPATAMAAWALDASGSAKAGAGTLQPPTALSVAASCTPTSATTISFVGASSDWSSTSPLSVASPAGLMVGDLLLAHVGHRFTTTLNASGWTKVQQQANGMTQAVFHRWVTDPAASYAFTASTSGNWAINVVAYRGVDKVVPVTLAGGTVTGIQATGGQTGSGATVTAPSLSTTSQNTTLVGFFGAQPRTTLTSPSPAGTRRAFIQSTGSGSADHNVAIATADRPIAATGATGAFSITAGTSVAYVGQVVALKPESFPRATVSWTNSASPWAADYHLRRRLGGALQHEVTVGTGPYLDTPLVAGTTYDYEVRSRASLWSSTWAGVQHSTVAC